MKQYSALVVDDEVNNRQNLISLLAIYCPEVNVLGEASTVNEAKELVKTISPEVVFLDIEMPGGNGFKLLEGNVSFKVIFVTAYDAYALKAIKFSALDYLLKPIDRHELIEAVARLKEPSQPSLEKRYKNLETFLHSNQQRIALNLQDEVRLVNIEDIVRIEADNNYSIIYLKKEKVLISKNLGYYYDLLKDFGFVRTHQSHLINKTFIDRFIKKDGGYLSLKNGDTVPVSRSQKENLLRVFSEM